VGTLGPAPFPFSPFPRGRFPRPWFPNLDPFSRAAPPYGGIPPPEPNRERVEKPEWMIPPAIRLLLVGRVNLGSGRNMTVVLLVNWADGRLNLPIRYVMSSPGASDKHPPSWRPQLKVNDQLGRKEIWPHRLVPAFRRKFLN